MEEKRRSISSIDYLLITTGLKNAKRGADAWQNTVVSMFDSLSEIYNLDKAQFFADCGTEDFRR